MEESRISSEIDAIIAQAMAEYQQARGIEVFNSAASETNPVEDIVAEGNEESQENGSNWEGFHPINNTPEVSVQEEIPANSDSILVSQNTSRFSGAIWFDNIQTKDITLAGLGGIGSYVAFLLSRMHPRYIHLYDDDAVGAENLSGQLYGVMDIGSNKAYSISGFMSRYSEFYNTNAFNERFTSESPATDIMVCGFDNMEARKTFFYSWVRHVNSLPEEERQNCLFIDGRLAAESFQVLCVKGDDTFNIERYKDEFLFSDAEADETVCSYKQTSFMANMIASIMVNLFVNFCANQCDPLIPRDLPFFTEYTAETMYFKVVS